MKFVYFGYDFMLPAVKRLIGEGHELMGIFTFECDNVFNYNSDTVSLSQETGVPAIFSQPEDVHIDSFLDKGTEVFIAAGYRYKIPPVDESRAYAMNLHPSYLPMGRGLMPTPTIIMSAPEAGGVTVHKMTQKIDGGDILYQEKIDIHPDETVETYSARVAMRGPAILSGIMKDLPEFWSKAQAQDESRASTFPVPDHQMRSFNWGDGVKAIKTTSRAFGYFGSLCQIEGKTIVVYDLDIWEEEHEFPPGTVMHQEARTAVIAANDGFVMLKNFQIVPENQS